MWEYFEGKSILITGGSGFLGTAITYRLLTQINVKHVYVLCRGGIVSARSKWLKWLPGSYGESLTQKETLSVLDGDILLPNMGLCAQDQHALKNDVNIIIHAASSINLGNPLKALSRIIIGASEQVADFALTCKSLECFVYISTAYVNTHLHVCSSRLEVDIDEKIYHLEEECDAIQEWEEVRNKGTSAAYEAHEFPWAYAYAKHLTERLLSQKFSDMHCKSKLLIIRPSIIGPAQQFPFRGYSMPMSTPSTMLAAALALVPCRKVKIATQSISPETEVHLDEVPVDVVVDRLLCHLVMGSTGCVHAVSGKQSRHRLQDCWKPINQLRRIPWPVKPVWVNDNWKTSKQHAIARIYVILGTSFAFSDDKTVAMSKSLSEKELTELQLFTTTCLSDDVLSRTEHIRYAMDRLARRSKRVALIVRMFY